MDKQNLIIANEKITLQKEENEQKTAELALANQEISYKNREKENCADQLGIAKDEIAFQKEKRRNELSIARKALAFEKSEKKKRAVELDNANKEIAFQNEEIRLTGVQIDLSSYNLDALINTTQDLLWSVDTDFRLITSNRAFDDAMVMMSGSVIEKGATILDIGFEKEQREKYRAFYQRAFEGEVFTEYDQADIHTNTWSEISFYPISNEGVVIGTACYSRDVTDRKNVELHLVQRNKELEEFADMVSHKLRGPVASILGAAAMFGDPKLEPEEKALLADGINEYAMKLDDVISELNQILQIK